MFFLARNEPTPAQREGAIAERAGWARVEDHAAPEAPAVAQAAAERLDAGGVGGRDLLRRLDFERDQGAVFFQHEVHFAPGAVAPEPEAAVGGVEGAPGLERLEKRLFEPESLVLREVGRCSG